MSAPGSVPEFLAIAGSTATGKTALSLALAERQPAEVVSMDSRQVYRGMDIGTAKVGAHDRRRVVHHGLDLIGPLDRYSAGQFARDARQWIPDIRARGRIPLLVGGTGFFLKSVLEPIFAEPALDATRVERLRMWLSRQDRGQLEAWTRLLDPARAAVAIQGGPHRMGRTLEVALLSGRALSWWHEHAPAEAPPIPGMVVWLDLPRDEMNQRINDRVTRMVEDGLLDEVRGLLDAGVPTDAPGMTGTGYREVARHLSGEISLEQAIEEIRHATRRYSRRQITWYRHQLPEDTLRIEATRPIPEQVDRVLEVWNERGGHLPGHGAAS